MKNLAYWIVIFILGIGLMGSIKKYNNLNSVYEKNILAMTDSIKLEKNKNDKLVASKYGFECEISDLQNLNDELYEHISDLTVKNKNLEYALYTKGEIDYGEKDTTYIIKTDTIYKGFNYDFNFDNDWRKLSGNIIYKNELLKVNINKDITYFDYTLGVDKNNRIYITSDNPYVKYNELTGFTIPKPKKYNFSIGPSFGTGYGLINNKFDLYVGLTASWNMIKF